VTGRYRGIGIYLLWQIPGYAVAGLLLGLAHEWGWLSPGGAVVILVLWIAKDLAVYPLLARPSPRSPVGPDSLVGTHGTVESDLAPRGLVRVNGELWRAEPVPPARGLAAGTPVVVRATRRLTLFVEPLPPAPD